MRHDNTHPHSALWKIIQKQLKAGYLDTSAKREPAEYKFKVPSVLDIEGKFRDEVFQINQVRGSSDPMLDDILDFLSKEFTEFDKHAPLNQRDDFKRKIEGKTRYGTDRPAYRCLYTTNHDGEIVAVRVYELLPLLGHKEVYVFYAIYIILRSDYRGGNNIAPEMYTASLMDAAANANKMGGDVKYLIAECRSATERLQNRIGLKRVYLKEKTEGPLKELEFYQSPIEFEPNTGEAISGASPEHFMMMDTAGSLITPDNVYSAVATLFNQHRSNHPREYFENEDAFLAHEKIFDDKLAVLRDQLYSARDIVLLSKEERAFVNVIEFREADENKTY